MRHDPPRRLGCRLCRLGGCAGLAPQGKHHKAAKLVKLAQTVEAQPAAPADAEPEQPSMTLDEALGHRLRDQSAARRRAGAVCAPPTSRSPGQWRLAADDLRRRHLWRREIFLSAGIPVTGLRDDHDRSPIIRCKAQITVTQPIFRSGRTIAEISRAKALVRVRPRAAHRDGADRAAQLRRPPTWTSCATRAIVEAAPAQCRGAAQASAIPRRLEFNAGSLTRTDVAQSEARLAGAQSDLTTAQGQLAISRANFVQAIGRPAETLENKPDAARSCRARRTTCSAAGAQAESRSR